MSSRAKRLRRRRQPYAPWLVGLCLAALLLAVGVALGMALEDNPKPNLTVTTTKTIVP